MTRPKPKPLKVVEFKPERADEDVVAIIEELLARAKTGEIRHFAYAAHAINLETGVELTVSNQWGHGDQMKMIAHAQILVARLTNELLGVEMGKPLMAVQREKAVMVAENIPVGHALLIQWGFVHKGGFWLDRKKREVHFITNPAELPGWAKGTPIYLGAGWSAGEIGKTLFELFKANRFVKCNPYTGNADL